MHDRAVERVDKWKGHLRSIELNGTWVEGESNTYSI